MGQNNLRCGGFSIFCRETAAILHDNFRAPIGTRSGQLVLMKEAKMPELCFYRIALTIQLNRNEGLCNNALTPPWQPWCPGAG